MDLGYLLSICYNFLLTSFTFTIFEKQFSISFLNIIIGGLLLYLFFKIFNGIYKGE